MRWSKPDMDGYMKEIHNTVDTIFNVVNANPTNSNEQ